MKVRKVNHLNKFIVRANEKSGYYMGQYIKRNGFLNPETFI